MDCRGVSEVVGFILVLSVILMGLSLTIVYGLPSLKKQMEYVSWKSMENTMYVIRKELFDLQKGNVLSTSITLNLNQGRFYTKNVMRVSLGANNFDLKALVYDVDGLRVMWLDNAILMGNIGYGYAKVADSGITNTFIPLVCLEGNISTGGICNIQFRLEKVELYSTTSVRFTASDEQIARAFASSLPVTWFSNTTFEITAPDICVVVYYVNVTS